MQTQIELIDIGVNLTNKRLCNDIDVILRESAAVGVKKLIITGTSILHSQVAIEMCQQYPDQLLCTCGIHPHDAKDWNPDTLEELSSMILKDSVRAVGETGLDFNRNFSPREQQIDVFQQQIELAVTYQKPIFLHQRDAFDTFYSLLREYRDSLKDVVVHCFTDNRKALFRLLDLDCHIGITGWICDERRGQELQKIVKDIPQNRLMLETDAPYLIPRDLPEKPVKNTNLPKYLPHILHTVARLQQKQVEKLATEVLTTSQNFFEI